jgi:hypothetical protein
MNLKTTGFPGSRARIARGMIAILIPAFLSLYCFSQTEICEENATGVFWPVKMKGKMYYYSHGGNYVVYYDGDSMQADGKVYFKELTEYDNGNTKTIYLREQDGNIYIYDTQKKIEFLELSNNITPGYSWEKYDKSWKYTVIDTTSSLTTPYCNYKGLLQIKAEPRGEIKKNYSSYYNLYFKRGVGLVGLNINGEGYSFLSIDRSLADEKSAMAPGCENLISEEERNKCTSVKISGFIAGKFNNYEGKIKSGTIELGFVINEKGEVENVSVIQKIKNAEEQLNEAIKIVKLLTFIPQSINGKPVKSYLIIPISF